MNGSLSVESRQGAGTTLTIRFPAAPALPAVPEGPDGAIGAKQRLAVMVVDDEPLVAEMLKTFLESLSHRASVFLDGVEAVEAFQQGDFDLALVDLGLPIIDGWEVARRIHDIRPDAPIIVATGWNMTVEDGHQEGVFVNAVLRKPFALGDLAEAIEDTTKLVRL